jgi:hypothetical protein
MALGQATAATTGANENDLAVNDLGKISPELQEMIM